MTLAQRHGFTFKPTNGRSVVVQAYLLKHFADHHWDLRAAVPEAQQWIAIVKADQAGVERVYGVIGWSLAGQLINVSDFYLHASRWGVLAGYAALEKMKRDADAMGVSLVTCTPADNTSMVQAYLKTVGGQEVLRVFRYDPVQKPNEQETAQPCLQEVG